LTAWLDGRFAIEETNCTLKRVITEADRVGFIIRHIPFPAFVQLKLLPRNDGLSFKGYRTNVDFRPNR